MLPVAAMLTLVAASFGSAQAIAASDWKDIPASVCQPYVITSWVSQTLVQLTNRFCAQLQRTVMHPGVQRLARSLRLRLTFGPALLPVA